MNLNDLIILDDINFSSCVIPRSHGAIIRNSRLYSSFITQLRTELHDSHTKFLLRIIQAIFGAKPPIKSPPIIF
ncbi:hypothetical protein FF38_09731 [Lucilia cuprina]|uniref:Uncharacterized protein n=1 Tax=Lucilia cuprina TaxID=7375 RepID=A0A0L0CGS2_LUCCU|nr:hypothetical protein FF38_09731 [Lucilia cuprina]